MLNVDIEKLWYHMFMEGIIGDQREVLYHQPACFVLWDEQSIFVRVLFVRSHNHASTDKPTY